MKSKIAALFTVLVLTSSSQASLFSFSYNLWSSASRNYTVSGVIDGTQNGQFVQNASLLSCSFSGISMPGEVCETYLTPTFGLQDGAVFSFDSALNNFNLSNYTPNSGYSHDTTPDYWYFNMGVSGPGYGAWAQVDRSLIIALGLDMPYGAWSTDRLNNSWTLTSLTDSSQSSERHGVPDSGESLILVLTGVGVLTATKKLLRFRNQS